MGFWSRWLGRKPQGSSACGPGQPAEVAGQGTPTTTGAVPTEPTGPCAVNRTGLSRYDAAVEFGVQAAQGSLPDGLWGFPFREAAAGRAAGEGTAADVRSRLMEPPRLDVYTDGTCNLFYTFRCEPDDESLFRLAEYIKARGGLGFQAVSCPAGLQSRLMAYFELKNAVRIQ